MVRQMGFEPMTLELKVRYSTPELLALINIWIKPDICTQMRCFHTAV